jgi:hypothetical protein
MSLRRRPRLAIAIVALVAAVLPLVAACGVIPDRPIWWPKNKQKATTIGRAGAAAADQHVAKVADPWQPGMRQLGIDVYWQANKIDDALVIQAKARRIINYAISLHANSIGVSFPFYTTGITSNRLYANSTTPSPADIAMLLAAARQSNIRVTLRPLLNETILVHQNPNAWRGTIEPTDRAAWFASYLKLLTPYVQVAAAGHAATFVVGTELESLEVDPHWSGLIASLRKIYSGQLLWDENFDEFALHDDHLPLAAFGVDAYPRFLLPDSASVDTLAANWTAWLSPHTAAVRRHAILSEVGIAAVPGAYPDPGGWLGTEDSPVITSIQTKWYAAVCRAVAREHIGGLYWWEVSFDANPAKPREWWNDRLTFLGRPAQNVISTCFKSLAGTAA